jgi:hypothetical protein
MEKRKKIGVGLAEAWTCLDGEIVKEGSDLSVNDAIFCSHGMILLNAQLTVLYGSENGF